MGHVHCQTWSWYLTATAPSKGIPGLKTRGGFPTNLSAKYLCKISNLNNFIIIIIPQAQRLIDDSGLAPTFKMGKKYEYLGIKIYFNKISTFLSVVVEIFCDIRLSSYLNTLRKKKNIFSPCKRYFWIN